MSGMTPNEEKRSSLEIMFVYAGTDFICRGLATPHFRANRVQIVPYLFFFEVYSAPSPSHNFGTFPKTRP